jgi:hypothetical protein
VDLGRGSWPDSARPTPDWSEQPSPDISPTPVKARTASPLECPFIEVSNPDRRAGDAETKLYRRC